MDQTLLLAAVQGGIRAIEVADERAAKGPAQQLADHFSRTALLDAEERVETALVRPLPGKMPDGIVLSPDEQWAYVHERNTSDVAVLRLDRSTGALQVTPVPCRSAASTAIADSAAALLAPYSR